ncbi:Mov34-domain-containing protein [Fomitiporia mediterranea MF3/22]|uniref:Mov34-domain-containing protein n=1 Tax=Fomitiporia mediterranea (strain MF3/22) TaxID=694068 RepID=UPI00044088F3|nr:Mov34-domain-containing protein [Fomitiporia mediterranea MF3/22]EJD01860.1 Mov34-domain-containing protein [Fomitiporia mediterranea MF3/22]
MYGPREPSSSRSHSPACPPGTSPRPPVPERPPYDVPQTYQHPPPLPSAPSVTPTAAGAPPRISPTSSSERRERGSGDLRTVSFPRAVLPRFLSIAAVNTAKNRETCGLLLGRQRGSKFVVTTLLIPKQHSTSDTCNMDEEELVLDFTETRGLITLGWIHTHPTQSCFMSSVDLHTHSGFQRMLPESFAVVCAPQHTPNFGIFRLTDPPGLQTILDCDQQSAFHPHPELPIYTDADKGHVQMRDMDLEIVDLR